MGRAEKLLRRFLSKPNDFTYDELKRLLSSFGYKETRAGKTSGSRAAFINNKTKHIIRLHRPHPASVIPTGTLGTASKHIIRLHRPHPEPELKRYQLNDIEEELKRIGVIK